MVDLTLSDTFTVLSTLLDVAEKVMEVYYLPEQIVWNALKTKGCAWLTSGDKLEDRNGGVHIGADNAFFFDVNSNLFDSGVWKNKEKQKYSIINWIIKIKIAWSMNWIKLK